MFNAELLAFILYFAVVLGIGIVFFFRSKGGGDREYFLGGRKMGPWVTAMSAQASDMSGWLLMGFPGSILAFGLGKVWIGIGLAVGTTLNWILVAARLRRFSAAANDSITLPQYLSNRFAAKNPALQIICAIIFLVFFTIYVASGFVAGGTVFSSIIPGLAGKDGLAMGIFAVLLIIYTFLGGYKAVCWTDFVQGIMMLCALLAVPIIMVRTGSLDGTLAEKVISSATAEYSFTTKIFSATPQEIISGLAWGFGYFGMPHILVRFMGIRSSKLVKKSATVAIVWVFLSLGAAMIMAWLARMFVLPDGTSVGEALLAADSQKTVFIYLSEHLFPPFIAGILLSAIIAAAMSTADSQLLVASSSFTSDIYESVLNKKATNRQTIVVARICVIIVAIVAYIIASIKGKAADAIMTLVDDAWGGFGAAFGPVILLSLYWRRMTYKGAVAGVVGGAAVDVLWLIFLTDRTGVYELFPGFIAGLICCVIFTLIDKEPSEEVKAVYDKGISAGEEQ